MTKLLIAAALLLLCTADSTPHSTLLSSQNMLMGDKIRLGSTPPSCHNRCNLCNPCLAVQVPTLPGSSKLSPMADESSYKRYPNYKPLGWKCRCGNRLFNP